MEEIKSLQTIQGSELSRRLMALPAGQRLDAILEREDTQEVLRALAPRDFYFSVQDIGPEDALPLLALADVSQINHIFDIEWWQKDSVLLARAVEWLDRLARASEESLLEWLYQADFELLVMLFKKWITVDIGREDEDPMEVRDRLSMSTIDDTYYWEVRYPQYEDFIRNLLGLLFEVNQGFYGEIMKHVMYSVEVDVEVDMEVEEDAYRFHRGRLEDNAIPDFYDVLEIYRPIKQLRTMEKQRAVAWDALSMPPPSFAVALVPEGDCLSRTLGAVQDPSRSARFIRMIEAMEPLEKELKVPWQELKPVPWSEAQISELQDVTLGALVLTSAANFITKGFWAQVPLEVKFLHGIFPLLDVPAMTQAVTNRMRNVVTNHGRLSLAEACMKPILENYAHEMGMFSKTAPPEPQYVKFFLFTDHGQEGR